MDPKELLLYYTAVFFVAALLIMRKRPRRGMLLRLSRKSQNKTASGRRYEDLARDFKIEGAQPLDNVTPLRIERPLNVVFNYNGESWDAYEILGLPAGSSLESVEKAYQSSLVRADASARPFLEAAFHAIKSQWESYKISKGG